MRTAGFGPLLLATLLFATCYNPQIADGGLRCSALGACPAGFTCNRDDGFCYKEGSIPPVGGMGGPTGGTAGGGMGGGGVGGGGVGGGGTGGMCMAQSGMYGPFPGCMPTSSAGCDAVCQTGCGCNERCKLEGGIQVCRAEGPTFAQQYQDCDPKNDSCRPGTICLQESRDKPACGSHCYRHCTTDAQCPDAKCSIEIEFGNSSTKYRVCSPPKDTCDPWGTVGKPAICSNPSRRAPAFGCYVMSGSFPDIAICDCAGTAKINDPCTYEHECEPGAECVLLGTSRLCRKVCKLGVAAGLVGMGGCLPGQTCSAFLGGSVYGYCHM